MRAGVRRVLLPLLLVGLALPQAAPVQAASGRVRPASSAEQQLGTQRDIPCVVGSSGSPCASPSRRGQGDCRVRRVRRRARRSSGRIRRTGGGCPRVPRPGWARMVCQRCPACNEAQLIWVQPAKKEVRLMIAPVGDGEAAAHVRLDPDKFSEDGRALPFIACRQADAISARPHAAAQEITRLKCCRSPQQFFARNNECRTVPDETETV